MPQGASTENFTHLRVLQCAPNSRCTVERSLQRMAHVSHAYLPNIVDILGQGSNLLARAWQTNALLTKVPGLVKSFTTNWIRATSLFCNPASCLRDLQCGMRDHFVSDTTFVYGKHDIGSTQKWNPRQSATDFEIRDVAHEKVE